MSALSSSVVTFKQPSTWMFIVDYHVIVTCNCLPNTGVFKNRLQAMVELETFLAYCVKWLHYINTVNKWLMEEEEEDI